MALGLPVISTNCLSGPSEILEQGRSGVLVDVKDHHAMGNAMLALLQDDDKYYFFKTRSLQRASQFDVNIIGEQYIEAMCV
jgi:glycosyltransferase involved in cell wall biosynthesis